MAGRMVKKNICKWYSVCPIKYFYEQARLDRKWVEDYCWVSNKGCVRRELEEKGIPHPDNMLPDGSIVENL